MSKARLQKKLQERQDQANARLDEYYTLYNSIRGKTINNKDFNGFIRALDLYNKKLKPLIEELKPILSIEDLETLDSENSTLKTSFLVNMPLTYTPTNINKLLSILDVDLANFTYKRPGFSPDGTVLFEGQVFEFTAVNIMVDRAYAFWSAGKEKEAKELFECFVDRGLPVNEGQSRNNVLIYVLSEYIQETNFIKMFIESGHLNINSLVTPGTDEMKSLSCITPIIVAATYYKKAEIQINKELIWFLLENGADPYLADRATSNYHNIEYRVCISETSIGEKAQQERLIEFDTIINEFYLKKLEEAAAAEIIKIAQEELPEEGAQTEVVELTGPADAELRAEEARTTGVVSESKILDQYIDYKKQASANPDLPEAIREEHRFDALVLRYIQTRNEALLESIDEFLSAELAGANSSDYINCLMQMNTSIDDASEVLASNPQLLHQFCTLKKQTQADAHFAGGLAEDLVLQEGIYPVPNTKIFLKVSTEFLATLDGSYKEKVLTQLSNPKFIAANSCGISGIKDYGRNISKLKIARTDENLVSLTRYNDMSRV